MLYKKIERKGICYLGTTMGAGGTDLWIGVQSNPPSLVWENVKYLGTQVSPLDALSLATSLCLSSRALFALFAASQSLLTMPWLTSLHTTADSLGNTLCWIWVEGVQFTIRCVYIYWLMCMFCLMSWDMHWLLKSLKKSRELSRALWKFHSIMKSM